MLKKINQVTQNDHTLPKKMRHWMLLPQRPWIIDISYRSYLLRPPFKLEEEEEEEEEEDREEEEEDREE